jgi:hypothetical protein
MYVRMQSRQMSVRGCLQCPVTIASVGKSDGRRSLKQTLQDIGTFYGELLLGGAVG